MGFHRSRQWNRPSLPTPEHVTRLYERIRQRKGHTIAVGAVARHLAEATYWMMTKNQPYQEPVFRKVLPRQE
jgi:hypothetical protein